MLLQKNKQLNLTILIPPDMPMASIQNIKRPYITPAIEECFDCESEDWFMANSYVEVEVPDTNTDDDANDDEFTSKGATNVWFDYGDNDIDY